jgi:ActR/RegA family two-component response regulator
LGGTVQKREVKHVNNSLEEEQIFAKVILNDASVVDLQLANQPGLSEIEENRVLHEEVGRLLNTVYPNTPTGYSKTIDNLRMTVASYEKN